MSKQVPLDELISGERLERVIEMYNSGVNQRTICRDVHIGSDTLYRIVAAYGLKPRERKPRVHVVQSRDGRARQRDQYPLRRSMPPEEQRETFCSRCGIRFDYAGVRIHGVWEDGPVCYPCLLDIERLKEMEIAEYAEAAS